MQKLLDPVVDPASLLWLPYNSSMGAMYYVKKGIMQKTNHRGEGIRASERVKH